MDIAWLVFTLCCYNLLVFGRSVDASAALAVEGVHTFVDVNDVPGSNMVGVGLIKDDPLFADGEVCILDLAFSQ